MPDVHAFPGHIACNPQSRSEIVVPLIRAGAVRMVLDIDSSAPDDFSDLDREALESLLGLLPSDEAADPAK